MICDPKGLWPTGCEHWYACSMLCGLVKSPEGASFCSNVCWKPVLCPSSGHKIVVTDLDTVHRHSQSQRRRGYSSPPSSHFIVGKHFLRSLFIDPYRFHWREFCLLKYRTDRRCLELPPPQSERHSANRGKAEDVRYFLIRDACSFIYT